MTRFFYVSDKDKYFDESTGRLISFQTLSRKLAEPAIGMQYVQQAKFVSSLKANPVTYDQLVTKTASKKKSKGLLTDQLYERMKPLLPVHFISNSGVHKFVISNDRQEAMPVSEDTVQGVVSSLIEHVPVKYETICQNFQDSPEQDELQLSLKDFFNQMIDRIIMDSSRRLGNDVPKISWDNATIATKQFYSDELKEGPTPNWDSFLYRLDYPEIFKAWVYSLVQPENAIRQALILSGAGNDGKSSVAAAICKYLGDGLHTSMTAGDESSKFFLSKVHGKVLLNYDDCKNVFILSAPVVKSITGGAQNAIEYKGKNAFNAYVKAHMLITTNLNPIINPTDASEVSRLLLLRVKPLPKDFQRDWRYNDNLVEEMPAFLCRCRESYEKLISPKATEIVLSNEQRERMVKLCTDVAFVHLQEFVENRVVFQEDEVIAVSDFIREINDFWASVGLSRDSQKYNKLYLGNFLANKGVQQENARIGGKMRAVYKGMTLKEAEDVA